MLRIVQVTVSVALIAWIVTSPEFLGALAHLNRIGTGSLFLCIPVLVADRWLMSAKWNMLLRSMGSALGEWQAFRIYSMAGFVGLFLPATVGADLSRVAMARREGASGTAVASSILIERGFGFFALLWMCLAGVTIAATLYSDLEFDWSLTVSLALVALAGFFVAIYLSFDEAFSAFLLRQLRRRQHGNAVGRGFAVLEHIYVGYLEYTGRRSTLLIFFLLSIAEALLLVLLAYLIMTAMSIDVDFLYAVAAVSVVTFMVRLPISIDGFGVYEKGMQFFLVQLGVSAELGLSVGIAFHIACLIAMLPGGILLAMMKTKAPKSPKS